MNIVDERMNEMEWVLKHSQKAARKDKELEKWEKNQRVKNRVNVKSDEYGSQKRKRKIREVELFEELLMEIAHN